VTRAAPTFDLILITDPALADPVTLMRSALAGAAPGRVAVQLRAKQWGDEQRLHAALALHELVRATDSTLLINGDPQLCVTIDGHGVQLPGRGHTIVEARTVLGVDRWIGSSCHDRSELLRAAQDGADFAVLGPWNMVPNKGPALGPTRFGELTRESRLPIYALGGIGHEQIQHAVTQGARGVAVIRELHQAHDPARWVQDALTLLTRARVTQGVIDMAVTDSEPPEQ